jgi:hypothetical protein
MRLRLKGVLIFVLAVLLQTFLALYIITAARHGSYGFIYVLTTSPP